MVIRKFLLLCFLTFVSLNTFSQDDLKEVKLLLAGDWKSHKRITTFKFLSDSTGTWEVENILSTAPLFIIYEELDTFYLGSIDMLGTGEPYPFEIVSLNERKLILRNLENDTTWKYKRK